MAALDPIPKRERRGILIRTIRGLFDMSSLHAFQRVEQFPGGASARRRRTVAVVAACAVTLGAAVAVQARQLPLSLSLPSSDDRGALPSSYSRSSLPTTDATDPAKHGGADVGSRPKMPPCVTTVAISQNPARTLARTIGVRVDMAEPIVNNCIASGGLDVSTLRFIVDGVDRTSYFTLDAEAFTAIATALPVEVVGDSLANVMVASVEGYNSAGAYGIVSDTAMTIVYAGVQVIPDSGAAVLVIGSANDQFRSRVRNRNFASATYSLACSASGAAICSGVQSSSGTMAPGQTTAFTVSAAPSASPGAGTVGLIASNAQSTDSSRFAVQVVPYEQARAFAPYGNQLIRAACPTIGAGAGSAVQCGDLLYAHSLPGYRSLNEGRGLTLLYNSATARPAPVLALDYTTLYGDTIAQMLAVKVWREFGGSEPDVQLALMYSSTASYSNQFTAVHRLVVPLDHQRIRESGAHSIRYEVYEKRAGAWQWTQPVVIGRSRLLVIDRGQNALGAGWSLAGVERLHINQRALGGASGTGAMLEMADGSALYYDRTGQGTFQSPVNDHSRLEQLVDGRFRRTLTGNRVRVTYGATGFVESVTDSNPSPNVGRYYWTSERLDSVVDPTGKAVRFSYSGLGAGVAGSVTINVPTVNTVTLFRDTLGTLERIVDPDSQNTRFAYDPASRRMTRSHARGTAEYRYTYDLLGLVDSAIARWPCAEIPRVAAHRSAHDSGNGGDRGTRSAGWRVTPGRSSRFMDATPSRLGWASRRHRGVDGIRG